MKNNVDPHRMPESIDKIQRDIAQAFDFARHASPEIDPEQLDRAFTEAMFLARSGLFGSELAPDVSVDPYGECTFSHQSDAGYIDIGVRGENELSWHVRNDVDPARTVYGDHDWRNRDVPRQLFDAIETLGEHLRQRQVAH